MKTLATLALAIALAATVGCTQQQHFELRTVHGIYFGSRVDLEGDILIRVHLETGRACAIGDTGAVVNGQDVFPCSGPTRPLAGIND
jgi:hypothetical protein